MRAIHYLHRRASLASPRLKARRCGKTISTMAADLNVKWSKVLSGLPVIRDSDVEAIVTKCTVTPKNSMLKGWKFYLGCYVHDVEVKSGLAHHNVRARCFYSQKKTGDPYHSLRIGVTNELEVLDHSCGCKAGKGFCSHKVALLYQLSSYQKLCYAKVPEIVSKTEKEQQWSVRPRTQGFVVRPVSDVTVHKPAVPSGNSPPAKRKCQEEGMTTNVWNALPCPLSEVRHTVQQLLPTLESQLFPPQWLHLWMPFEETELVDCKFGQVPKGSVLSYQEKPMKERVFVGPETPPEFHFVDLKSLRDICSLPHNHQLIYNSLKTSLSESQRYEKETRPQSKCQEWYKLRQYRLTASNFRTVTARRGRFQELASDFLKKKTVVTPAMQFGIDNEGAAADKYACDFGVDIHPVGFVVNPSAPYLGCSPDRRVFDTDADPKWGLLEIKCTKKQSIGEVDCFRRTDEGFELKKTHKYYDQCMGQLGVTGEQWCDFYLLAQDNYHLERIFFDADYFNLMKAKLEDFFFAYLLPAIVAKV